MLRLLLRQRRHARQFLSFKPFQKCAARGGNIGEILGHAGMVERRHRIAAARHRQKLARFACARPPALAAATVPRSKGRVSNAPNGPFQTSVAVLCRRRSNSSIESGPTSRIISLCATSPTGTVR